MCGSVQAICAAACFAADWPLLVVAPSSMLLTWFEALSAWLPPQCKPDPGNLIVVSSSKARARCIAPFPACPLTLPAFAVLQQPIPQEQCWPYLSVTLWLLLPWQLGSS